MARSYLKRDERRCVQALHDAARELLDATNYAEAYFARTKVVSAMNDLHELGRQAKIRQTEKDALEKYGPCPDCGGSIASIEINMLQEHWGAPRWNGWPVPPPEHERQLIGGDYETKITCPEGHQRFKQETVVFEHD